MIKKIGFVFAGLFTVSAYTVSIHAVELPLPPAPHIVVIGEGKVESVPDIVNLSMEVNNTAKDYATAKQAVDRIVNQAMQAATANGVVQADMQASQIQATPQYSWQDKDRVYEGERVSRTLSMQLKQTEQYNALVNALLASGITRMNAVQFDFSDRGALEAQALQKALDDAQTTAQQISDRLSASLGEVFQVAPVSPAMYPKAGLLSMAQSTDAQADLTPSKQAITQQVRVVFLLGTGTK